MHVRQVMPGGVVTLSSLVRPVDPAGAAPTGSTARPDDYCTFSLQYSVSQGPESVPGPGDRVQQVPGETGRPLLDLGQSLLPQPPHNAWYGPVRV